ncbi:MAG: hypothetical protein ACE5OP_12115 [Candidatus Glassbacteria bacterium]
MRIKVAEENLIRAIRELEGIDIVIKDVEEAERGLRLIIRHTEASKRDDFDGLVDINITENLEYPTTSVEYKRYYEIEFKLKGDEYLDMEIALIRELQKFFRE